MDGDNGGDSVRIVIVILSAGFLIAALIAVIGFAKYDALITEARTACVTAAALDLTKWIDLCRSVQFQE